MNVQTTIAAIAKRDTSLSVSNLCRCARCRAAGGGSHVGPFGLLALHEDVDTPALERMLAVAREFAEEWSELRGLHQQKLAGRLLRCLTRALVFMRKEQHVSPLMEEP